MPIIDAINEREARKFAMLDPKGAYARVEIKLDDVNMVGTDIEIGIEGTY